MKAWTIVAYTFDAEQVCRDCMRRKAAFACEAAGINSEFVGLEDLLDRWAALEGVDRMDEHTFDSGDFPKVVFASQIEDIEHCDGCGEEIL